MCSTNWMIYQVVSLLTTLQPHVILMDRMKNKRMCLLWFLKTKKSSVKMVHLTSFFLYVKIKTRKRRLEGGGQEGSAGQQGEVTGVHDEARVKVQALWGETQDFVISRFSLIRLTSNLTSSHGSSHEATHWSFKKKNPPLRGFQFNVKLFDEVWSLNMTPTLVKVELLVGRSIAESFDVHQVTVHVRVVQRAERHVCREEGQKCQQHVKCWFDKRFY